MNKIAIFIILFLALRLVSWIIQMKIEIKSLKLDKEIAEKRIINLQNNMEIQRTIYQAEIDRISRRSVPRPVEIPKGTIEAVRYAMIHNHPDNGGSSEKFILYKNCYDKLTGGAKY